MKSADQIADVTSAIAVSPLYGLKGDRLAVNVSEVASPITGSRKFTMALDYSPFLPFYGLKPITLTYKQNIYVPD